MGRFGNRSDPSKELTESYLGARRIYKGCKRALSPNQVEQVRFKVADGAKKAALAREYSVRETVHRYLRCDALSRPAARNKKQKRRKSHDRNHAYKVNGSGNVVQFYKVDVQPTLFGNGQSCANGVALGVLAAVPKARDTGSPALDARAPSGDTRLLSTSFARVQHSGSSSLFYRANTLRLYRSAYNGFSLFWRSAADVLSKPWSTLPA